MMKTKKQFCLFFVCVLALIFLHARINVNSVLLPDLISTILFCHRFLVVKDPHLRNLESQFALQQKIVEAGMKLANEGELCKTVKKKRRRNCLDAMRRLQEIENEINAYRIKTGKLPTQRASVIIGKTAEYEESREILCLCLVDLMILKRTKNGKPFLSFFTSASLNLET